MAIDKIFNDANVDGIADNIFGAVNNSVSEVKQMQQRKAAENVQMVIQALKKIESDLRQTNEEVANELATRIASIKDGKDGKDGNNAKDGRDGRPGRDGAKGDKGDRGLDGRNGIDGKDGVSVTDAKIDFDGSLIISLSTGQEINVGEVVSPDLADKIQVISTMSTNGAVGIKDEGTSISSGVKNINFVGATVTATNSGDDVTVNVSAGTGTVTSVAATVPAFLSVAGSPITTTGTLAISLSGTALPVANGGTGVTTSTGTTNVVLSNSPTLVTPALGTPSSGVVTNLTGTASININGTVGATTPSTGAFTTVSATSTANTKVLSVIASSSGDQFYVKPQVANSGVELFSRNSADSAYKPMALYGEKFTFGGNSTLATIDSSGNLGVGTTSPLSYSSKFIEVSNATSAGLKLTAGTSGLSLGADFSYIASDKSLRMTTYESTAFIRFSTQDTERARIDSSGNLGIGNTNNSALLHVGKVSENGDIAVMIGNGATSSFTASTATLQFRQGGNGGATLNAGKIVSGRTGNYSSSAEADSFLAFYTALDNTDTERMRLDSSGNLGIGTTTPFSTAANRISLSVNGTTDSIVAVGAAGTRAGYIYGSTTQCNIGAQNFLAFETNNGSERARIDSSGNLLVGTTSQIGNNAIVNAVRSAGSAYYGKVTTTNFPVINCWNAISSGDNIFASFAVDTGYVEKGTITYNRTAGLVAYNTTSDYRAKDIIGPVTGSGALIDSTPVYMGKMKDATQERPMFIAHEVPAYAHTGEKDAVDADGNPVYQQMDASALIPVMWAELQSLRARVAQLESKP